MSHGNITPVLFWEIVDLCMAAWNITEKQFPSQLMGAKPSKASGRQTLDSVSNPHA